MVATAPGFCIGTTLSDDLTRSFWSVASRGPNNSTLPSRIENDAVCLRERRWTVADDKQRDIAFLEVVDGRRKRGFTGLVQVRVRFVEYDQPWIAVDGASKTDPLPLAAGEPQPALADLRFVAVRQVLNHFMGVRKLCGLDHRPVVNGSHAGDVLAHGAGEQLDVLRHVADVAPELNGIPVHDLRPVEPDLSRARGENTDDQSA